MQYRSAQPIQHLHRAINAHVIEAAIPMAFGIPRLPIASPFLAVVLEDFAVAVELEALDKIVLFWFPPQAAILLMPLSSFNNTSPPYTSVGEVLFVVMAAAVALNATRVSDEPSLLGLMTMTMPMSFWQCEPYVSEQYSHMGSVELIVIENICICRLC